MDTVHNVRQIGKDAKMTYKDEQNGVDYDVRGEYDFTSYHSYKDYIIKNIKISRQKKESNLKMGT